MRCHTRGDVCDRDRANILNNLTTLDQNIKKADESLKLAEASGMEVSVARMNQDAAKDALTKARVTIHTYDPVLVNADIQVGMKIAAANLKAGQNAMVERDHRRIGLGVCLLAIVFMLVGLWLYIKQIER